MLYRAPSRRRDSRRDSLQLLGPESFSRAQPAGTPGRHADRLSQTVAGPGVWHAWTDSNSVTLLEAAVSLVNIFRPGRQNSDFSYYWILSDIPNNIELLKMVNITQDG
jgi:hypothetical protein